MENMKSKLTIVALGLVLAAPVFAAEGDPPAAADLAPQGEMVLWYRQPAVKWLEAMPLGNGLLGAMVFGGIERERIALNDCTFWSGRPHDYNDPKAIQYYPQIRELVFAGKFQEAEKMADAHFWGIPAAQQAYQPLGDLLLSFDGAGSAADYRRELNLETGVAKVRYHAGDAVITRECFVSYPDRVLVVRVSADKPGRVSAEAQLKSPYLRGVTASANKLIMDGCWKGPIPVKNWLIAPVEGDGMRFQTVLLAFPEGGSSQAKDSRLRVTGANAVTFVLTAATSFVNHHDIGGDPAAACSKVLADVRAKDYPALRRRHEADFRVLMDRVHLRVGSASRGQQATDERLLAVRDGGSDPNLEALCFQFGRYILSSSSRAGGQAANLQGIWNDSVSPPWGSKWTININTQMNYWPAEVCNLSECHQPLFDLLQDLSVAGGKTAKLYYGAGGWVTHHNVDLWRGTAPVDAARFGMWPVGGAWLCQQLWEHYLFTGDRKFLREYYPVMKGAAQFLLDVLVEEPKHHWLVTPFSMSPEHGYYDANGRMAFLSSAPTMDVAIMRELFPHCIEASKLLGVDEPLRAKLEAALGRLPPFQVNRLGYLQEWIEDWKAGPQGHNVSPNFTFYPGSSILLRRDPTLAAAIARWMEKRRAGGGWPSAWDLCVWARLERSDKVGAGMQAFMRKSPAPNLHNRGANQSDATFGFTAAVAEALVQSHAGEISLLPALPVHWTEGSVSGLRARGGFEVDIHWQNGKLQAAEIRNPGATGCKVRYGTKTAEFSLRPGQALRLNADLMAKANHREAKPAVSDRNYRFDGTMSREVLENYLSRSISVEGILNGRGDFDDNIRMLKQTGAKFIGRSLCLWGNEARLLANLERAKKQVPKVHAADSQMILQACIFEIVTPQVEQIPVPAWAFTAFGLPGEQRNFRYADMLYADGRFSRRWGRGSVPDVSRPETKLWFYFLAVSFLDAGFEAIHLGQTELMNRNDRKLDHYAQVLALIRSYAAQHARRHMVVLDSHVPSGGLVRQGKLLMDFHSFPLRIMEVPDRPQEAILKVGFSDGIYGRSKGGITPSGWECEHLPYLVELDNYGVSRQPGKPRAGGNWVWGYDEITWFAHQSPGYRGRWLRYAWDWVRKTDPNGQLQMPGSRTMASPLDRKRWYYANTACPAVPEGYGDEETIRAIWAADSARRVD
jgi:alpha-L-fucosidase 2